MAILIEMTSSEFRRKTKNVMKIISEGNIIAITFGKRKEVLGHFMGPIEYKKMKK